jgi:hypothetical protein
MFVSEQSNSTVDILLPYGFQSNRVSYIETNHLGYIQDWLDACWDVTFATVLAVQNWMKP